MNKFKTVTLLNHKYSCCQYESIYELKHSSRGGICINLPIVFCRGVAIDGLITHSIYVVICK